MTKKQILIICPIMIFPVKMGSQVRMYNLIKALASYHAVDIIFRTTTSDPVSNLLNDQIRSICNNFHLIIAPNKKNFSSRIYHFLRFKFAKTFFHISDHEYYFSIGSYVKKVAAIANSKKYDVIISEYWYSCFPICNLEYKPYLIVDTHDILSAKISLELNYLGESKKNKAYLKRYIKLENKCLSLNNLILSVSETDLKYFSEIFPDKTHLKVPIGQDWSEFLNYHSEKEKTYSILFYGSLESQQNTQAFFRLYYNILPKIKTKLPDVSLLVLGANPPQDIKMLNNDINIFVTGYVEDIKEYISNCRLMILPMELGGGFRTRALEVMVLEVPVIGTHNALDNLEITNGLHGYISDSDEELASFAVKVLQDDILRKEIGIHSRQLVLSKYSLKACYDNLSNYLTEI